MARMAHPRHSLLVVENATASLEVLIPALCPFLLLRLRVLAGLLLSAHHRVLALEGLSLLLLAADASHPFALARW